MDSRDAMINAVDTALKKRMTFVPLYLSQQVADDLLEQNVRPSYPAYWVPKATMVRSPYARNYYCSNCHYEPLETGFYCSNCGAKMEVNKDE